MNDAAPQRTSSTGSTSSSSTETARTRWWLAKDNMPLYPITFPGLPSIPRYIWQRPGWPDRPHP